MKIYRNKKDSKLYTLEHLKVDLKFADRGARCGLYAYPYKHNSEEMFWQGVNDQRAQEIIENNFYLVAEN